MSICSCVPCACSRLAPPIVRKGYDDVPTFAAWNHAKQAPATTLGSCIPPTEASIELAIRPLCAKTSSAALTSGIRCTRSPSKVGSLASLFLLCGRKCLVAICSDRSSTLSNVSRECSAYRGRLVSSSTSSHS